MVVEPKVGDVVEYRSFVGERWSAVVLAVHLNATIVDLDVIVPGTAIRVPLSGIRWNGGPNRCAGWPEPIASGDGG
jgi:hypothetical protein